MLTKSLDNVGFVDYYLKEGDYSRVTSTIDKWHQAFLKFRSEFHNTDTPLDIILSSKIIFFYDSWIVGKVESMLTLIFLLISSLIVFKVFIWISMITFIIELFTLPSTYSRLRKSSTDNDSSEEDASETYLDSDNLRRRKPKPVQKLSSRKISTCEPASNISQSNGKNVKSSLTRCGITQILHNCYYSSLAYHFERADGPYSIMVPFQDLIF